MPEGKVVLLVEDNQDDTALTALALRRSPLAIDLRFAEDGEKALDILDAPNARFDLILLDLKLPGLDGADVLNRIRQSLNTRYVPVVVLTSSDLASDIERVHQLGANSYVRKSLDFGDFVKEVDMIVHYWLTLNRAP